jgi:hypothetical protein
MVKCADVGPVIVLQVHVKVVNSVVILGDATRIVKVEVSTVQERVGMASWRLLVAEVSVRDCSLLERVGVGVFELVVLSWEPVHLSGSMNVGRKRGTRSAD